MQANKVVIILIGVAIILVLFLNMMDSKILNWKTYANAEYGFEIKYPENWDLQIGSNVVNLSSSKNNINAEIIVITADKINNKEDCDISLYDYLIGKKFKEDELSETRLNSIEKIKITNTEVNTEGCKVLWDFSKKTNAKKFLLTDYYFKNKDKCLIVKINSENTENSKIYPQIISTFRFIP